jgi:hypothetical protein
MTERNAFHKTTNPLKHKKGAGPLANPSWIQTLSASYLINGTIRSATMLMTLIIGLMAGPAVSL